MACRCNGTLASEIKVTDDDTTNEGVGCIVSGASWPYTTSDLDTVYDTTTLYSSYPDYTAGEWALNSANDTADGLAATYQNLFLAEVNNSESDFGDGTRECAWYSLAALDDVLQYQRDHMEWPPRWTGIKVAAADTKAGIGAQEACSFYEWTQRARGEAYEHDDIHKVVLIDELWRMMDGPDTWLWQSCVSGVCYAHWSPADVELLHDQVASGYYDGTECGESSGSMTGEDMELWTRMLDVELPRYVVPSAVLGMPMDPGVLAGGSGTSDYDLASGDGAAVTWQVTAPSSAVLSGHPSWKATLDFLYVPAGQNPPLDLNARVNGAAVSGLYVDVGGATRGEVSLDEGCVGGSSCGASAWNSSSGATNSVSIRLTASSNTSRGDERLVYVWAARIRYVDVLTGKAFWTSGTLDPGSASYGTIGSPGGEAFYEDNGDWLITEHVDGVQIPHLDEYDYNADAYERLVQHTCDYLHSWAEPRRCVVGVRGDYPDPNWYDDVDLNDYAHRLSLGDTHGDGIVSTWLPLPVDLVGTEAGRFDWKTPLDSSYDVMLYEPRMMKSLLGEHHENVGTVMTPAIPDSCDGTYTIEWEVTVNADAPDFHWYAEHVDGATSYTTLLASGFVESGDPYLDSSTLPDTTIVAGPGDEFHFYWVNTGDGGSFDDANFAHFRVVPPESWCVLTWDHITQLDDSWESGSGTVTLTTTVEDVYECITGWFMTGSCP